MKTNQLQVTIASVGEQFYDDVAASILVPGSEGQMQILANHEPLITTLKEGVIVVEPLAVESKQENKTFEITGGVLEVSNNHATILIS